MINSVEAPLQFIYAYLCFEFEFVKDSSSLAQIASSIKLSLIPNQSKALFPQINFVHIKKKKKTICL